MASSSSRTCGSGRWTRLPLPLVALLATAAVGEEEVNVYFGCGCFWHVQHAFTNFEENLLHRQGAALSARTAYAGGKQVGPEGLVCYHNLGGVADYGSLGHAEVVSLTFPVDKFGDFASLFWQVCPLGARRDPQDVGPEYRSLVGLPGGMNSTLLAALRAAGAGPTVLTAGRGDDGDTLGSHRVWVYDTAAFPAHTAEKYHQFHDDMMEAYGVVYHELRQYAAATKCPGDTGVGATVAGFISMVPLPEVVFLGVLLLVVALAGCMPVCRGRLADCGAWARRRGGFKRTRLGRDEVLMAQRDAN